MLYCKVYRREDILEYHAMRLYRNRDGAEQLIVRVEKESDRDAYAEFRLPAKNCYKAFGFSEEELMEMERFILNNEPLIWDDMREAMNNAEGVA